jgi:diguanylate cyclase (GGDEF)-like protein
MMEFELKPDAKHLTNKSPEVSSKVLETCIKLKSPGNFKNTMQTICHDLRDICDSEHFCILLMDHINKKCSVLCEAFAKGSHMLPMENYIDDKFYDIADSWKKTIAGSNNLIVKNKHDMDLVKERNPEWHHSITNAGGKTIVLFPLKFKNELLGYIWAINFSPDNVDNIRETLDITSFILSAEIYSFQLVDKLHVLSSKDMLTGVMNRNEMNNYVDDLLKDTSGKSVGVLFADLNGLKVVNDNDGHAAGDTLLKSAASALMDVFSVRNIFRAGGDEFVVILTAITEEQLNKKVEALRKASEKYDDLVFAIGSAYEDDVQNVRTALRLADERMYVDKKHYYELHPEKKRMKLVNN